MLLALRAQLDAVLAARLADPSLDLGQAGAALIDGVVGLLGSRAGVAAG